MSTTPARAAKKFVAGRTYSTRSACDHDCIFSFELVSRTEKTVTIRYQNKEVRRTVSDADGAEMIFPMGRFSMAPVLTADDGVAS